MPSQPDKPRKKPGPPKGQAYKMTEAVLQKLAAAFAIDATIEEACFYADISPATYYFWKKDDPEQFETLERLRNTPILAARETLAKAVKTDSAVALKYLERKRKDEFSTKTETDIAIKEAPQSLVEFVGHDTPDGQDTSTS